MVWIDSAVRAPAPEERSIRCRFAHWLRRIYGDRSAHFFPGSVTTDSTTVKAPLEGASHLGGRVIANDSVGRRRGSRYGLARFPKHGPLVPSRRSTGLDCLTVLPDCGGCVVSECASEWHHRSVTSCSAIPPTRLETRTKDFNMCASRRAFEPRRRNESKGVVRGSEARSSGHASLAHRRPVLVSP